MLKFFGLMTVKAHEADVKALQDAQDASDSRLLETVREYRDQNTALRLALRRERAATEWFYRNTWVRNMKTGQMMKKADHEKAIADMWASL